MSAGSVVRGALFCALLLACGERAGDPIVMLASNGDAAAPAQLGGAGLGGAGYDSQSTPPDMPDAAGPVGLCGACTSSDECGDANDACIHHLDERFCGRDCDDQHGCPDGYMCIELANTQLFQCVPQDHCPSTPPALAPLADIRDYLLSRLNNQRAAHARPALAPSGCLDKLAQSSALDFARTDEPLGKYVKECAPIWPNCACGWSSEAEVTMAHYNLDWMGAIDHAFLVTRDNLDDRFVKGFLAGDVTDVGIGFWLSGDEAWIALSFH
ncbi:MAG TPA: hypothetical protein VNG33_20710 [Polyangiaceae bacterium]|nr:hypothetical protein [Polyangiaceae bacterium]